MQMILLEGRTGTVAVNPLAIDSAKESGGVLEVTFRTAFRSETIVAYRIKAGNEAAWRDATLDALAGLWGYAASPG